MLPRPTQPPQRRPEGHGGNSILDRSAQYGCRSPDRCYNFLDQAPDAGVEMLDAYIIDRIRRERESREATRRPTLQMPMHRPPAVDPRHRAEPKPERQKRGETIIDFSI